MRNKLLVCIGCLLVFAGFANAQQAFFIDGYHGGIYGHYPKGQTSFIVKKMQQHPDWSVNLEIEPETWDVVKQRDPQGYADFKKLFKEQSVNQGRIEYVNPTYAQSYLFGSSGESLIRQFEYGIRLLRRHFPEAVFTTYSAEEPCFTSCLPGVLKSFGFSFASTKNPNTMWGGYVSAYGGELVNWVGPDGTKILTVPRYACEDLQPGSTWQSIAWWNSREYIQKCLDMGIKNPVGMCLQDADWDRGWDKGPWLGGDTTAYYHPTAYKTWRNYITNHTQKSNTDDWHFSQEDVLCGLMWGTQVMQRLTREIRASENKITQAEKMAAYARFCNRLNYPDDLIDEGWRNLLLSQHHDCWIVPYNRLKGGDKTWAEWVTVWTGNTNKICNQVINLSMTSFGTGDGEKNVIVFNTLATDRQELVTLDTPHSWKGRKWIAIGPDGKKTSTQWTLEDGKERLMFCAQVPSMGFSTYRFEETDRDPSSDFDFSILADGRYRIESDLYTLILNPAKGGVIESLQAKYLHGKEFVDGASDRSFNELRGFFINENRYLSSTDRRATIELLDKGAHLITVAINGTIGLHPFKQTIKLVKGEPKIDMHLQIDWKEPVLIGEPGVKFAMAESRKSIYDDRYKLLLHFPTSLEEAQLYKDAPFDVCKSRLDNTFYNSWDRIKHHVIVHWVDIVAKDGVAGFALLPDHTTSYAFGTDYPLSLNVQYAGKGLWGMDYVVDRPTEFSYSILPHTGDWKQSRLWTRSERVNEPLIASWGSDKEHILTSSSFLSVEKEAFELSAMYFKDNCLYVRFFNAQSNDKPKKISINDTNLKVKLVELDGTTIQPLSVKEKSGKNSFYLSIPPLGLRTLKIEK